MSNILQTQTTSFKAELYRGIHDLLIDTIKVALYTANADLNETTAAYTPVGEVVAPGYTAGGVVLTNPLISQSGFTAYVDFDDAVFNAAITARCALVYNASKGNRAIAVLDFGADKTSANFTLVLPPNTPNSAIIRSSN